MLNSVLLVDDEHRDFDLSSFQERGVQLHRAGSSAEAQRLITEGVPYDLVVLDWYLGGSSTASQALLIFLMKHRAVPVLIWSDQTAPLNELEDNNPFPRSLLSAASKHDVSAESLLEHANNFYERRAVGRLTIPLRLATSRATERTLWELAGASDNNVLASIKHMVGDQADLIHASEAIHQLILRYMLDEPSWRDSLREILRNPGVANPNGADYGRLMNLQRYFTRHTPEHLRSGDLVRIRCEASDLNRYAVIVTPACDVAQKNTGFLRLVLLYPENELESYHNNERRKSMRQGSAQDRHWLPYVVHQGEQLIHLVANFHEVLGLHCSPAGHAWDRVTSLLRFTDRFTLVGHAAAECQMEYIVSIDEPYRSSLLNRFSNHASRLGTPDVHSGVD